MYTTTLNSENATRSTEKILKALKSVLICDYVQMIICALLTWSNFYFYRSPMSLILIYCYLSLLCCTGNHTQQWCHSVLQYTCASLHQGCLLLKCCKCLNVRCPVQSSISFSVYLMLHLSPSEETEGHNMASQMPALPQSYAPGTGSVFSDQSGFYSLDSSVPGLSKVILNKLNMKDYGEYRYQLHIITYNKLCSNWHVQPSCLIFLTNFSVCFLHHPYFDWTKWNVCNKW